MINKVILIGNLGADPEVRTLESGVKVAQLRMATNEAYKDNEGNWQDRTEWHTVVLWRYLAERAEQRLKKGMLVYVEGKLSTRKWQDQEGKDRYRTEVVANSLRILNARGLLGESPGSFPSEADAPPPRPFESNPPAAGDSPTTADSENDDLPF